MDSKTSIALVTTFTTSGRRWANLNGSHGHHRAHQALMDDWKSRAVIAIRQQRCTPVPAPVTITAEVHRTRAGRADAHNVTPTIKACIDAAVACGLIEDDHDGIVSALVIRPGHKMPAPSITLTIEETP